MNAGVIVGLYAAIALGAVGVYFVLPRGGSRSGRTAGHILSVAALVGLLFVLARMMGGESGQWLYFLVFAALSLVGAVRMITHPKPVYCALYFVLVILAVVGMLVLQEAEFLAAALVIIYAGAILVTYLFVIMLAQQSRAAEYDTQSRLPLDAVAAGFILIATISGQISELSGLREPNGDVGHELVAYRLAETNDVEQTASAPTETASLVQGNTERIGAMLLTRYMMSMQVGGVLLLVAMVGAIGLARKHIDSGVVGRRERPVGQIGKTVDPF